MPGAPVAAAAAALATGLGLGLSLAAPPGPVNALIAREASRGGAWAGIRAGIAAPVLDTVYMTAVLLGAARLAIVGQLQPVLTVVGAAMLLYLAWATARVRSEAATPPGIWAVILVTLTNPFQYAWWLSAGLLFMRQNGAWGIAGFLVAIFGWVFVFSATIARGAAKWDWFAPLVGLLSADLLLAFGLQLAATAAGL